MDVADEEEESPPLHRLLEELQKSVESDKATMEKDRPEIDVTDEDEGSAPADSLRLELTAYLDMDRPLTEPKWVKSGQVEDWIKGGAAVARAAAAAAKGSGEPDDASWRMKLKVVDPDTVS